MGGEIMSTISIHLFDGMLETDFFKSRFSELNVCRHGPVLIFYYYYSCYKQQ